MTATNVQPFIEPDTEQMRKHLEHLFGGDLDGCHNGLIEIAWTDTRSDATGKHALKHARLFGTDQIEEAVEEAYKQNIIPNQNVYVGAALRKPDTPPFGRCTDTDFYALPAYYADLDEPEAARKANERYSHCRPTIVVVTGRAPHTRAQMWWRLETPDRDPARCRAQNLAIARALGGDEVVVNPSRVMRLAGTIAWPTKPGRVIERTSLKTFTEGRPAAYVEGQVAKAYPYAMGNPIAEKKEQITEGTDLVGNLSARKLIALIQSGREWHNNTTRLVAHWVNRGWSDIEILGQAPNLTLAGYTADQTRAEMQQMIRGARIKWNIADKDEEFDEDDPFVAPNDENSRPFSAAEFSGEPPERRWLVEEWIPMGTTTALYGDGGLGKTLLAQQLAYAAATGEKWIGLPVRQMTSLCVLCEDDRDELHIRHHRIKTALGHSVGNPFKDVHLWPRVGHDNLLITFDNSGAPKETPFFRQVVEQALDLRVGLLVLDTAADLFGGNEIIRTQVNYFIKAVCGRIIRIAADRGYTLTVLLLAHPSMSGMASGTGTGGSTAWNNAVRARMYLTKPENGLDDERLLTRMKANYSSSGEGTGIRIFYQDGVFIRPETNADTVHRISVNAAEKRIIETVREAWERGEPYKVRKDNERNLEKKMVAMLREEGFKTPIIAEALRRLKDAETILSDRKGDKRGWRVAEHVSI